MYSTSLDLVSYHYGTLFKVLRTFILKSSRGLGYASNFLSADKVLELQFVDAILEVNQCLTFTENAQFIIMRKIASCVNLPL